MQKTIPGRNITKIFDVSHFPCGEVNVNICPTSMPAAGETVFFVERSMDLMTIVCKMDILHNAGVYNISIVLPYMPYSRQDRYTAPGYSFALDQFAMMLDIMGFHKVYTVDVHSSAAFNVMPGLKNISTFPVIDKIIGNMSGPVVLVAPDEGAAHKVETFAQQARFKWCINDVVYATKVRDPKTGNITDTRVPFIDKTVKNILVMDDICDGGRTFTEIGKRLPQDPILHLFVTHGRFSKPDVFEYFDEVHSTDTIQHLHTNSNHTLHPIIFKGDRNVTITT